MLRRFLLASVAAAALAGSALAADLPSHAPVYAPPLPFTWTGAYVGGQMGYAWGRQNTTFTNNFGDFAGFSPNTAGFIGGGHAGYNLQLNQFVIGLEGDIDGSDLSSRGFVLPVQVDGFTALSTFNTSIGAQGSIRGRVGYAWDHLLTYATGGVAFAGVIGNVCTNFNASAFPGGAAFPGFNGCDHASTSRVGWTVGGGVEYAVSNNWSIRLEYRYSDFGHYTQNANDAFGITDPALGFAGGSVTRNIVENRVQFGVSYNFTSTPPAALVAKY
jgi:outer membrane immunogenic protein